MCISFTKEYWQRNLILGKGSAYHKKLEKMVWRSKGRKLRDMQHLFFNLESRKLLGYIVELSFF
jgi:hypothetical protein